MLNDATMLPSNCAARRLSDLQSRFAARLKELAKTLDLDELVVVAWTYDPAARHRSYELLAQAFGLEKTESLPKGVLSSKGARAF